MAGIYSASYRPSGTSFIDISFRADTTATYNVEIYNDSSDGLSVLPEDLNTTVTASLSQYDTFHRLINPSGAHRTRYFVRITHGVGTTTVINASNGWVVMNTPISSVPLITAVERTETEGEIDVSFSKLAADNAGGTLYNYQAVATSRVNGSQLTSGTASTFATNAGSLTISGLAASVDYDVKLVITHTLPAKFFQVDGSGATVGPTDSEGTPGASQARDITNYFTPPTQLVAMVHPTAVKAAVQIAVPTLSAFVAGQPGSATMRITAGAGTPAGASFLVLAYNSADSSAPSGAEDNAVLAQRTFTAAELPVVTMDTELYGTALRFAVQALPPAESHYIASTVSAHANNVGPTAVGSVSATPTLTVTQTDYTNTNLIVTIAWSDTQTTYSVKPAVKLFISNASGVVQTISQFVSGSGSNHNVSATINNLSDLVAGQQYFAHVTVSSGRDGSDQEVFPSRSDTVSFIAPLTAEITTLSAIGVSQPSNGLVTFTIPALAAAPTFDALFTLHARLFGTQTVTQVSNLSQNGSASSLISAGTATVQLSDLHNLFNRAGQLEFYSQLVAPAGGNSPGDYSGLVPFGSDTDAKSPWSASRVSVIEQIGQAILSSTDPGASQQNSIDLVYTTGVSGCTPAARAAVNLAHRKDDFMNQSESSGAYAFPDTHMLAHGDYEYTRNEHDPVDMQEEVANALASMRAGGITETAIACIKTRAIEDVTAALAEAAANDHVRHTMQELIDTLDEDQDGHEVLRGILLYLLDDHDVGQWAEHHDLERPGLVSLESVSNYVDDDLDIDNWNLPLNRDIRNIAERHDGDDAIGRGTQLLYEAMTILRPTINGPVETRMDDVEAALNAWDPLYAARAASAEALEVELNAQRDILAAQNLPQGVVRTFALETSNLELARIDYNALFSTTHAELPSAAFIHSQLTSALEVLYAQLRETLEFVVSTQARPGSDPGAQWTIPAQMAASAFSVQYGDAEAAYDDDDVDAILFHTTLVFAQPSTADLAVYIRRRASSSNPTAVVSTVTDYELPHGSARMSVVLAAPTGVTLAPGATENRVTFTFNTYPVAGAQIMAQIFDAATNQLIDNSAVSQFNRTIALAAQHAGKTVYAKLVATHPDAHYIQSPASASTNTALVSKKLSMPSNVMLLWDKADRTKCQIIFNQDGVAGNSALIASLRYSMNVEMLAANDASLYTKTITSASAVHLADSRYALNITFEPGAAGVDIAEMVVSNIRVSSSIAGFISSDFDQQTFGPSQGLPSQLNASFAALAAPAISSWVITATGDIDYETQNVAMGAAGSRFYIPVAEGGNYWTAELSAEDDFDAAMLPHVLRFEDKTDAEAQAIVFQLPAASGSIDPDDVGLVAGHMYDVSIKRTAVHGMPQSVYSSVTTFTASNIEGIPANALLEAVPGVANAVKLSWDAKAGKTYSAIFQALDENNVPQSLPQYKVYTIAEQGRAERVEIIPATDGSGNDAADLITGSTIAASLQTVSTAAHMTSSEVVELDPVAPLYRIPIDSATYAFDVSTGLFVVDVDLDNHSEDTALDIEIVARRMQDNVAVGTATRTNVFGGSSYLISVPHDLAAGSYGGPTGYAFYVKAAYRSGDHPCVDAFLQATQPMP